MAPSSDHFDSFFSLCSTANQHRQEQQRQRASKSQRSAVRVWWWRRWTYPGHAGPLTACAGFRWSSQVISCSMSSSEKRPASSSLVIAEWQNWHERVPQVLLWLKYLNVYLSAFKCPVQIASSLNFRLILASCVPGLVSSSSNCTMAHTLLRQRYVVIYPKNTR